MTKLKEVDRVEILTLQDNYVDLVSKDDTEVVNRAMPLREGVFRNSIICEHGFSALVDLSAGGESNTLLFDFGFSETGVLHNVEALGLDLGRVDALALSHGHMDHTGGLPALARKINKPGLELVAHPAAFRNPRYVRVTGDFRIILPSLTEESLEAAGVQFTAAEKPYYMLNDRLVFLGRVPRKTSFEQGMPNAFYSDGGEEKWDDLVDDSAVVMHLSGKGLVVLTGCAHSGVVNTVQYARQVTGVDQVHAVMGGFHLSGPDYDPAIQPTIDGLKAFSPDYVIPAHCTGRKAAMAMEAAMPEQFLLNMCGTKMTFAA